MFEHFPSTFEILKTWRWKDYRPYYEDLLRRPLAAGELHQWMADTERFADALYEVYIRLEVACMRNTADQVATAQRQQWIDELLPHFIEVTNIFDRSLIESGLIPDNFALPLQRKKMQLALFHEKNTALAAEEKQLEHEYNQVLSNQSVHWEGASFTTPQLKMLLAEPISSTREQVWRSLSQAMLKQQSVIHVLWQKLLGNVRAAQWLAGQVAILHLA